MIHVRRQWSAGWVLGVVVAGCVPGVKDQGPDIVNPPFGSQIGPRTKPGLTPSFGSAVTSEKPARAITGGTLLALSDARTAVAADPDRDRIFVADYRLSQVLADLELNPGDEPGRVVEDGAGRVHVILRGGGALVTLTPGPWQIASRRAVCAAPRGLAYESGTKLLHVACAEGELVSLPAEPNAQAVRRVSLDRDLRDVVVDGTVLLVSRFRSAEVLTVDAKGTVIARSTPASRRTFRNVVRQTANGLNSTPQMATLSASVAWRMVPLHQGEAILLHQRALEEEVVAEPGGYGSNGCGGIVESTLSSVGPLGTSVPAPTLPGTVLAVDVAVSPNGKQMVVAAPGNSKTQSFPGQVVLLATDFTHQQAPDCSGPRGGVGGAGGGIDPVGPRDGGTDGGDDPPVDFRQPSGDVMVIGVAYDRNGHILAQTRDPASIQVLTASNRTTILTQDRRRDSGLEIFHSDSSAGLACASCHPEGGDDGRVWRFRNKKDQLEVRRTQNLRGGVLATAPFHWNGDLKNMSTLMNEVFVGRMGGPELDVPLENALEHWMDTIPALPRLPARDPAAADRGRTLFGTAGCATCHTGSLLTTNATVDVGTGRALQVPSLRGVGWRAPYMHDGCALRLNDRFTPQCGGTGDRHGVTSKLTAGQLADLAAFVETL
jgi:mono/diheme cytochrome c family protein